MIHRKGDSYSQAAGDVVNGISLKIEEFLEQQNEPPDEKTSTVEVLINSRFYGFSLNLQKHTSK
jgi:hypothetical protein